MDWNYLGNEWAVNMLRYHIAHNDPRHAYLFTGVPGVGRRTLALRFARALNCRESAEPGIPCGKCRTCLRIERMQYPDLSIVEAETEGGILKVELIRQLQHTLSLTPYEGRWRVALLMRFEEANPNAQNALLKTLEEAPPSVILVLTAANAENLLPTIVSRCEEIRLRPLPVEELARALEKEKGMTSEDASRIAHLSQGRVGTALRLSGSPEILQQYSQFAEDMIQLLKQSRRMRFGYATRLVRSMREDRDRGPLRTMLQVWIGLWRDIYIEASGAALPLVNLDEKPVISSMALRLNTETARQQIENTERALTQLDNTNANPQMLLETLMLNYPRT